MLAVEDGIGERCSAIRVSNCLIEIISVCVTFSLNLSTY